ncbi:uncharacterized protein LOC135367847 [Ornithodoros turicata]|uniref:uncharacterized protein LOC135367847 n=1 Tax=Ornithodoros turicata TaxID=34597 RepID=UPI00313A39BE
MDWDRKKDIRNLASENTTRWNGTGKATAEIGPRENTISFSFCRWNERENCLNWASEKTMSSSFCKWSDRENDCRKASENAIRWTRTEKKDLLNSASRNTKSLQVDSDRKKNDLNSASRNTKRSLQVDRKKGAPKFGLMKHQEVLFILQVDWDRKKGAPKFGLTKHQEVLFILQVDWDRKGPSKFGLTKHQEVDSDRNDLLNLASEKPIGGMRGKTTALGVRKDDEMEFERKNGLRNLAAANSVKRATVVLREPSLGFSSWTRI